MCMTVCRRLEAVNSLPAALSPVNQSPTSPPAHPPIATGQHMSVSTPPASPEAGVASVACQRTTGEGGAGEGGAGQRTAGEGGASQKTTGEGEAGQTTTGEGGAGEKTTGEGGAGENTTGEGGAGERTTGEGGGREVGPATAEVGSVSQNKSDTSCCSDQGLS